MLAVSPEVREALESRIPVVALESTIISHGMPYPRNVETAHRASELVRCLGGVPAMIAVIDGTMRAGLTDDEVDFLGKPGNIAKISRRDLARCLAQGGHGATTVSATMIIAHRAGVDVFATGGVGGVHRHASHTFDVSADLIEFSRTPTVVVSAGAKAILDIAATIEYLETQGVPVFGYQTDEFPAFYSRTSGCPVPLRADTFEEIAKVYCMQQSLDFRQGMLVANPVPMEYEIPRHEIDGYIETALADLKDHNISGPEVTPFLLKRIVELSNGQALQCNVELFLSNVRLACGIAEAIVGKTR